MKKHTVWQACLVILLASCTASHEEETEVFTPQVYEVSGKVEKGPFISGSVITIQPLDAKLQTRGKMYSTIIQDNAGSFSLGNKEFDAPYAELMANGYFFNEVTGRCSVGTLNLRALADLSDRSSVNVNILTHLKYQRVLNLVAAGKNFSEANIQAQKELLEAFGLQRYAGSADVSSFSIGQGTDEAAALIAVSSLLLVDRSEAALTEYLTEICKEFGKDGTFGQDVSEQMSADKKKLMPLLTSIQENVVKRYAEQGVEVTVKDLSGYIDWDGDGIAGNETLQEGQTVALEPAELSVPYGGGTYRVKITSPIPVLLTSGKPLPDKIEAESVKLYSDRMTANISLEKEITDGVLTVRVNPLESGKDKQITVPLYDCLGNQVAELAIRQAGNPDVPALELGRNGEAIINDVARFLATAFSNLSLIQQYYHYNKEYGLVEKYLKANSSEVYGAWSSVYSANRYNLTLKELDQEQLNAFQNYFDVLSALYYYHLTVMWGDVPYIYATDQLEIGMSYSRTKQAEIFADLEANLQESLKALEEKKNESLKDADGFFFVSKDVARILLADIYMYQGKYQEAEPLLAKVITNGFYSLSSSHEYGNETEVTLGDGKESANAKELIYAFDGSHSSRSRGAALEKPSFVPVMTYTDVVLSYAECLYKNGKTSQARSYWQQVMQTKGITSTENEVWAGLKDARLQLFDRGVNNFAFLKRTGWAQSAYGVEAYRLLLPIPASETAFMPQNPGY